MISNTDSTLLIYATAHMLVKAYTTCWKLRVVIPTLSMNRASFDKDSRSRPGSIGCSVQATNALASTTNTHMKPKNTICLWFDKDAHDAARFYAATFPDSAVTAVHKAPGDYPGGKEGEELTVEFTVVGIPCLGLNGGPEFRHSEAFSFQIATD